MNKDIQAMRLKEFCNKLNLVKGIAHLHGLAKTPTHQHGSKAIDGIFLSEGLLEDAQGGFLKFREATFSDHWAIWLDIQEQQFGFHKQTDIKAPKG